MNHKCVSALSLSHLHSQTEIAGFGTAIIFCLSPSALPVPPLFLFKAGGGAEVIACDALTGEKRGGIALQHKVEIPWEQDEMYLPLLKNIGIIKIEAAAAAEYF